MKRRSFLKTSSIFGLPIALGGIPVSVLANKKMFDAVNSNENDRILILIQLNGGNDGLNTLIPLDQYANLVNARQNIIIPSSKLLSITDVNGLHPVMGGLSQLFEDGKLNIVQNVGYPNQNRSHFRSTDIWNTASEADEYLDHGWVGRYLDSKYNDYPENYPNETYPDPFALTMGYSVSETCQGQASNFSIAVTNPEDLKDLGEYEGDLYEGTCYGNELTFVRNEIKKTNAYSEVIINAYDSGNNLSDKYNEDSSLAQQLKTISRLIAGGLKTKVYIANLGGFDTHSDQTESDDPSIGKHANLLGNLSNSIAAFQEDLELLGLAERVVGMTYSEFGRQIRSNLSNGTDHGTASPLFVFGSCVNPTILGDNPDIGDDVSPQAGVAMQFDFRSVYGSILMDWFEISEVEVKSLLFEEFQYLNILNPCAQVNTNELVNTNNDLKVYPNPNIGRSINIAFESLGDTYRISLFDVLGHEIKIIHHGMIAQGSFHQTFDIPDLVSGQYILRVVGAGTHQIKMFIKT